VVGEGTEPSPGLRLEEIAQPGVADLLDDLPAVVILEGKGNKDRASCGSVLTQASPWGRGFLPGKAVPGWTRRTYGIHDDVGGRLVTIQGKGGSMAGSPERGSWGKSLGAGAAAILFLLLGLGVVWFARRVADVRDGAVLTSFVIMPAVLYVVLRGDLAELKGPEGW
jgi:hypothetical protein